MVCKKSLYCLKNGPCATDQIRKQIWEENIRFRQSLRNINQSDHYWSFQVTNNELSDLDEPSVYRRRTKALWKSRNCYDCASVTHNVSSDDLCKNCICHNKFGHNRRLSKGSESLCLKDSCPETKALNLCKEVQTQAVTPGVINSRLNSSNSRLRLGRNVSEYAHRYRNSLLSAQLNPSTKYKFSSQSNLIQPKKSVTIRKCPSMENLSKKNFPINPLAKSEGGRLGQEVRGQDDAAVETKVKQFAQQLSEIKLKSDKSVAKDPIRLPPWLSGTPLSRTTRRMLNQKKQIPFVTFGCNNINDAVGAKRTHNVLASSKEVYPNALSAKQQREDMIVNSLKTEKMFRNSLLRDNESKRINHSSLWANEVSHSSNNNNKSHKQESCSLLRNKLKKVIS